MKKILFLLVGLLALAQSPMPITITGASTTVQIQTTSQTASWVQLIAPSGNMGTVRVGDGTTSSTVGLPLAAGSGMFMPPDHGYNLNTIYVYVATGDTLRVLYMPY